MSFAASVPAALLKLTYWPDWTRLNAAPGAAGCAGAVLGRGAPGGNGLTGPKHAFAAARS